MNERIRFHLDENVDLVIATALRRYDIDVTTSVDVGILASQDNIQLEYALRENRVIVTHDADFLRMASQGHDHAGIAYCRLSARSIGEIVRALRLIFEVMSPEEMWGRLEYI